MQRGPKPRPTRLKLIDGVTNPRRLNLREPEYAPLDLSVVPDELVDEIARSEWTRIAPLLSVRGHVTAVDRSTLLAYCELYARWRRLEHEARVHPMIVRAPTGYPIPSPAVAMANRAFSLMLRAASELGITPSSRSRVSASGDERSMLAPDAFTRLQQRRPAPSPR
jgi:P27 family predicted phage terminase small subunit